MKSKITIYTCQMHPEVQEEKPGKCPKCGMTLVPVEKEIKNEEMNGSGHPMPQGHGKASGTFQLPKELQELDPKVAPGETTNQGDVQVLKASYTSLGDISPNKFTVKANQPVRFEIAAKDDGQGCMGSVTIPNLTKKVEVFTKGQTTTFEFTPSTTGTYNITCAMGIPRGQIQVN